MYQEIATNVKWSPDRNLTRNSVVSILVVALLALSFVGVTPRPAHAWTSGECTSNNGVTVVVDFGSLGGGTTVRCAQGSQSSGVSALRNAGFSVTNLSKDSAFGFFVCRIDGQPTHADDKCVTAPPRSAYWSYWHASRGGNWTFSSMGAGSRTPPAGSVEGWRFGGGGSLRPSVSPPAKIPVSSKPTSPASTPSKNTGSGSSGHGSSSTSGGSSSGGQGTSANRPSSLPSAGQDASNNKSVAKNKKDGSSRTEAPSQTAAAAASDGGDAQAGIAEISAEGEAGAASGLVVLGVLAALGILGAVFWSRRPRDN